MTGLAEEWEERPMFMRSAIPAAMAVILVALLSGAAIAGAPSPRGARVYFHYPIDGIHVPERFTARIGLSGMGVAPAGVDKPNTGHNHLLVDTDVGNLDLTKPIPNDYNHIHMGNGQTEVTLTLPPGRHTLQLLMGDYKHIPHTPPVISKKITIYVR